MSDTTWRSTLSIKLALAACALMPLGALGTKFGLWPFTVGFLMLAASVLLALTALIIAAIYIFKASYNADKAGMRGAALLAFIPVALVAMVVAGANDAPRIHNITTNLNNPPSFEAILPLRGQQANSLALTEEVIAMHRAGYPNLKPLITTLTADQATAKATEVANSLDWKTVPASRKHNIEATVSSFWFGFTDDIVIRVTPAAGGSIIDLRSVSRVGQSDLGANAKRINKFISAFSQ